MSTLTISVDEAQNQLRDLLARARRSDEVLIAEDDKSVVRLVCAEAANGAAQPAPASARGLWVTSRANLGERRFR